MRRANVVVAVLAVAAGMAGLQMHAYAQQTTGDRFCKQYASRVTETAKEALARDPSCKSINRFHTAYQFQYNWCLKSTRDAVYRTSDQITQLASQCKGGGGSPPNQAGAQGKGLGKLGRVWHEKESGWTGTWTRVGTSNTFKATWTHPTGGVVRADLTIMLFGNAVTVVRRDTYGPGVGRGCKYTGKLVGANVSGTYQCDWGGQLIPWSARISN